MLIKYLVSIIEKRKFYLPNIFCSEKQKVIVENSCQMGPTNSPLFNFLFIFCYIQRSIDFL